MKRLIIGWAIVASAVLVAVSVQQLRPKHHAGASPAKVAGVYVKNLAAANSVDIIGDKVWRIVHTKNGQIIVVVRVRFQEIIPFLNSTFRGPISRVTIYVHEIASTYQVVG